MRVSERRPGLTADALDAFGHHVTIAADADVELGFIVVDDAFDRHLSPGHVEAAPLVDDVDRQQRALFLSFRHRRERPGERKQDADFDLGGFGRLGGAEAKHAAEDIRLQKNPSAFSFPISSN